MGPLSDDDLDGLLRELGLPAHARPFTPAATILPKSTPIIGFSTLKLLAAGASVGIVGGLLSLFSTQHDRSVPSSAPTSVELLAPPTAELEPSLPESAVGGAAVAPPSREEGPIAQVTSVATEPTAASPTDEPLAALELPDEEPLPRPFRRASGAPPRVRMVASAKLLGARGGVASGPEAPGAYALGALTVTGRVGAAEGNALLVGGSFDLGARLDPAGPRLSGALTGLAGLSRESGSRRLDLAWTLTGRVTADPAFVRDHAPDGDHLSTGPLVALSLGAAAGARVQVGLSAQAPLEPGGWGRPVMGLSLGVDLAPRS